jgi:lipopolysaccharide/colanic/teichoic acid biosynthesis glycosyltransferase
MSTASDAEAAAAPASPSVPVAATPMGYRIAKRTLDITGSGIAIVLSSPLLVAIAVAVRVNSPGPILFRQERVGLGGRPFTLFKFRSMDVTADEEEHRQYVSRLLRRDDPGKDGGTWVPIAADRRVTRVGSFLRRSHLDELPQLLNILRGDMSLVGPRPPIPYEVALYEPWHLRRLAVLPGLTGLWQATAWGRLSFDEGVRLDLDYVERRSFWLDLRILARTLWQTVIGRQF